MQSLGMQLIQPRWCEEVVEVDSDSVLSDLTSTFFEAHWGLYRLPITHGVSSSGMFSWGRLKAVWEI